MNLANKLTVLRILLIPVFICALVYYSPEREVFRGLAAAIFAIACLTDGMDGYIARRFHQRTDLGSYIDPIADKLLILSAFISLSFMGHLPSSMRIPAWVTIAVVSRDVLIIVGSVLIFLITAKLKAEPLFVGKLTTVSQMMTLSFALISAPEDLRYFAFVLTVGLTVLSGIFYIRMGARMLE